MIPKLRSGSRQDFRPRRIPKLLTSSATAVAFVVVLCLFNLRSFAADLIDKPNVLFIAVDDLNDWVGCLGGHPQAKTPNIDKLASKGVLFEQAHCAAPLCSPSRTAIMMGLRPSTTGIYGNLNWFRDMPQYKDWVTLPQYFRQHGYIAWGGGKLYHQAHGKFSDAAAWDHVYSTRTGAIPPPKQERYKHGLRPKFESNPILARLIDWGPTAQPIEANPDWKTAHGAAQFLQRDHDKPFFLGCGIYLPHLPWYAPQKFFDMHPLEDIKLPPYKPDDFDDIPAIGKRMGEGHIKHIRESGKWKEAVQGCLASDSFADACVGHVLDALEKSRYRDNTIVVFWGDHGYDVGEKKIAKSALWEQTTRTPLIIYAPPVAEVVKTFGIQPAAGPTVLTTSAKKDQPKICKSPVSLVDLYPTLLELCGLPSRPELDGRSLAPLVNDTEAAWPYPAIITHSPHWIGMNHAVRSRRHHYIHYSDGGEELYDVQADPHQWNNIADDPKFAAAKTELKKWLPKANAPHFRADANLTRSGTRQEFRPNPIPKTSTTSAIPMAIEEKTRIHRLATTKRSIFDAFSYLNRLPDKPYDEETPEDLAARIFSRLANQEGRILLKAPPGMDQQAYDGFKTFLRDTGDNSVGNCSACHRLPDFSDGKSHVVTKGGQTAATLSLRNIGKRDVDLRAALQRKLDAARQKKSGEADTISDKYSKIQLSSEDVSNLIAFLKLLDDVSDERFRELILNANVLDTLKE